MNDKIIKVIEEGSRQLNLDLIVRVPKGPNKGQRAHETNTSVVDLYNQYQSLHKKELLQRRRLQKDKSAAAAAAEGEDAEQADASDEGKEIELLRSKYDLPTGRVQLLIEVKASMFTVGEPTEMFFSLYSRKLKKFVSEEFMVELTALGMPANEKLINNIRTVFRDVSETEYLTDLFLVIRIYRKGKLVQDPNEKMPSAIAIMKQQAQGIKQEGFRRPFGVAVMDLTPAVISDHLTGGKEYAPGNLALFFASQENNFSNLHERMLFSTLFNTFSAHYKRWWIWTFTHSTCHWFRHWCYPLVYVVPKRCWGAQIERCLLNTHDWLPWCDTTQQHEKRLLYYPPKRYSRRNQERVRSMQGCTQEWLWQFAHQLYYKI